MNNIVKPALAIIGIIILGCFLLEQGLNTNPSRIINDPEFIDRDTWSNGLYQCDTSSSYVHWENKRFVIYAADNISNDQFGWGFLHQGMQPHEWGIDQPLAREFVIRRDIEAKPNTWFLKVRLRRSNITWFDVNDASI
ncbi:MAG: hypothetical protein ACTSUS_09550, partial [Candidatus Freyarchaeota archaeon]